MALTLETMRSIERLGMLKAGVRVLDFGSSNLYDAAASDITALIRQCNPGADARIDQLADRLAADSGRDASGVRLNRAFAGELFEAIGMHYDSIDIAEGYKTTIVDLNVNPLPPSFIGAYDLVLNLGTSEHILHQLNTFKQMHDAIRVGGLIYHCLPSSGYHDHGYFTYNGRFFFDLAGYNKYELVDFSCDRGDSAGDILASARQYSSHFSVLGARLPALEQSFGAFASAASPIPDVSITVIYRKTSSTPFLMSLDTNTTVGGVSDQIYRSYDGRAARALEAVGGRPAPEVPVDLATSVRANLHLVPFPELVRATSHRVIDRLRGRARRLMSSATATRSDPSRP